eukprot:evm.model.NODE_42480_length_25745_cov_44.081219.2
MSICVGQGGVGAGHKQVAEDSEFGRRGDVVEATCKVEGTEAMEVIAFHHGIYAGAHPRIVQKARNAFRPPCSDMVHQRRPTLVVPNYGFSSSVHQEAKDVCIDCVMDRCATIARPAVGIHAS